MPLTRMSPGGMCLTGFGHRSTDSCPRGLTWAHVCGWSGGPGKHVIAAGQLAHRDSLRDPSPAEAVHWPWPRAGSHPDPGGGDQPALQPGGPLRWGISGNVS